MLNESNARIAVSLKNPSRAGELTTGRIRSTTQDAVVQIAATAKARTTSVRDTARGAVIAAAQSLQETGEASHENIAVAVEGIVEGVRRIQAQRAEAARAQPGHANTSLSQQREVFAESVREALEGAKDAASSFSGNVKTHIETAVGDLKLKNAQLLGLTRGAVKQAVNRAIEAGTQLEETVVRVTSDATEKALAEGPFIAERVASVTESVLAGAVEAAEEIGADVNQVSRAAAAGIKKGVTQVVEKPSDNVSATERSSYESVH